MLLIDGNSLGYAAHGARKLTANGMETQAIFGFLRTVRNHILSNPNDKPLILWDGPRVWRYSSYDDYKGNRKTDQAKIADKEAYHKQVPIIMKACARLGIPQLIVDNMEADDLAGDLVAKCRGKQEIKLITGDQDWLQLVQPGVCWFDGRYDKFVDVRNFEEVTGFSSGIKFLQGKAIQGDSGDNLPGVGGLGEGAAKVILQEYGSVANFFKLFDAENIPKSLSRFRKKLIEFHGNTTGGRDKFKFNMNMMCLIKPVKIRPDYGKVVKLNHPINSDEFLKICQEFAFISIIKNSDKWLRPFAA